MIKHDCILYHCFISDLSHFDLLKNIFDHGETKEIEKRYSWTVPFIEKN